MLIHKLLPPTFGGAIMLIHKLPRPPVGADLSARAGCFHLRILSSMCMIAPTADNRDEHNNPDILRSVHPVMLRCAQHLATLPDTGDALPWSRDPIDRVPRVGWPPPQTAHPIHR